MCFGTGGEPLGTEGVLSGTGGGGIGESLVTRSEPLGVGGAEVQKVKTSFLAFAVSALH